MKSTFTLLLLVALTLNLGCIQTNTVPIKIKLNLEKEYTKSISKNDFWVKNQIEEQSLDVKTDSIIEHYYDITIDIENVGEKDLYIWMMSCSWYNNFKINNNYIYFYNPKGGCDSNIPELKKIESKSKITIHGTVRKSLKFDYPAKNTVYGEQVKLTKVGLIITDDIYKYKYKDFSEYNLFMEDKSKQNLIWSNGINLLTD
ncbi:hypothetical protein AB670_01796 [Chryseobacterium sp. MOF25P]|uniref:hypothetical protein n=1 Tax=unclassified Chryseobacterium TaxID=2593645 RepID=UPI0008053DD0|nr:MULTISPECIES: hypothetical protein [unclassified Chryseobacterium]OBW41845.1 hypothetical protein AB670_01796 [Chryseobacterium sp. MOF25P]OBW43602.1 hypothetical protein AB671_04305 [Chryseobacterium sp. BGARF1]